MVGGLRAAGGTGGHYRGMTTCSWNDWFNLLSLLIPLFSFYFLSRSLLLPSLSSLFFFGGGGGLHSIHMYVYTCILFLKKKKKKKGIKKGKMPLDSLIYLCNGIFKKKSSIYSV